MFNNSLSKNISKIIEKDERHPLQGFVSALDVLKLARKRYIFMKEILKPLVIALSKYIEIVDISFYDSSSDDFIINLEYKNGD